MLFKDIFNNIPFNSRCPGKSPDNCRVAHDGRGINARQHCFHRNTLTCRFHLIRIGYDRSFIRTFVPVLLHGFTVERKQEIKGLPAGPDAFVRTTYDGKIMPAPDKRGVIKIQVNMVADMVEQLGNQGSCTVDTITRFSSNQHRYVFHETSCMF